MSRRSRGLTITNNTLCENLIKYSILKTHKYKADIIYLALGQYRRSPYIGIALGLYVGQACLTILSERGADPILAECWARADGPT